MHISKSCKGGSVTNLLGCRGQIAVGRQVTWSRGVPKPCCELCSASTTPSALQQTHCVLGLEASDIQCSCRNHRIIEWFGLEGTLKIIWFQPPCHQQGHLPPDQVAQSSVQPGLEPCQGGGSHSCSGQPGPGFHHPHREEFLPQLRSRPPSVLPV